MEEAECEKWVDVEKKKKEEWKVGKEGEWYEKSGDGQRVRQREAKLDRNRNRNRNRNRRKEIDSQLSTDMHFSTR